VRTTDSRHDFPIAANLLERNRRVLLQQALMGKNRPR
jgi:hypothetical protein